MGKERILMRKAEIILELPLATDVGVFFHTRLEVSLDCSYCKRTDRTVVLQLGASSARCIHSGYKHQLSPDWVDPHPPFPGRLVDLEVSGEKNRPVKAVYRLEYQTSRFEDAKYGPDRRPWTGHPTWARAHFILNCHKCSAIYDGGIQNNVVRPYTHRCDCGYRFFTERRELPILRWLDPETGRWALVPERWSAG